MMLPPHTGGKLGRYSQIVRLLDYPPYGGTRPCSASTNFYGLHMVINGATDVMPNYLKLIPMWIFEVMGGTSRSPTRRHSTDPFLVIGHRGSPCFAIENTLASFRRAVEQEGANGLECDLCLTKDNQIVLWHDWDPDEHQALLRESGLEPGVCACPCPPEGGAFRRPICELTLAEFYTHFCYSGKDGNQQYRDCVPLLDAFLDWVVGRPEVAVLFFDVKVPASRIDLVPGMMQGINGLLERYRPAPTCIFECATVEVLTAMKAHSPQHHYALDVEPPHGIVLNPAAYSAVRPALEYGNSYATAGRPRATTLAPWTTYRRVVQHDIRVLHRLRRHAPGRQLPAIISFTIDEEKELRTLIKMGVAGIQTNRPDLLRAIADEMGVQLASRVPQERG
jgi:glycerophosphoryl diester phosphodiesterase